MTNISDKLFDQQIDTNNIEKTKNKYIVSDWTVFFNEDKNPANIRFKYKEKSTFCIGISNSNGWIRIIHPFTPEQDTREPISLTLTSRILVDSPSKTLQPFVFSETDGRMTKCAKFNVSDGKYHAKIFPNGEDAEYWVGFETTEQQIDIYISSIEITQQTIGSYVELNYGDKPKVSLPIAEYDTQGSNYRRLEILNNEFAESTKNNEIEFIVDYTEVLRKIQMVESYISLVKHLIVRFDEIPDSRKQEVIKQIQRVVLLTNDSEIFEMLSELTPKVMLEIDLPNSIFKKLVGFDNEPKETIDENIESESLYDVQNNYTNLYRLLKNLYRENKGNTERIHELVCLLANTVLDTKNNSKKYRSYLNSYLNYFNITPIKNICTSTDNLFKTIEFHKVRSINYGPKVSIIVSAYQSTDTITYSLNSLLNQSYRNIEILVCDDKSDDQTLQHVYKLAETDSRIRVFQSLENQGTYNIRNNLIGYATGEYITFQDSDDISIPDRIEEQVRAITKDNKLLCLSDWLRIEPNGNIVIFSDNKIKRFCVVSSMFHISVFKRMPKYRKSLVAADTEFYEQFIKQYGESSQVHLKKPLLLGLWGDGSLTKKSTLQADSSGFVSEKRRLYSDIAARQRALGSLLVSDQFVDSVLYDLEIYRKDMGVKEMLRQS